MSRVDLSSFDIHIFSINLLIFKHEQRILIVKIHYQNAENLTVSLHKIRAVFPSSNLIVKFDIHGNVAANMPKSYARNETNNFCEARNFLVA